MKELIKKRWFVFLLGILIAVVVLFGIGFILYCNGYRITYPQQFETSWDAVSSVGTWAGVVVSAVGVVSSFIAIWIAIQVPKRIANRQDRISLFEKRYQVYNLFMILYATMNVLKNTPFESDSDIIKQVFDMYFDVRAVSEDSKELDKLQCKEREEIVRLLHSEARKIAILFPVSEDYEREIHHIVTNLYSSTEIPPSKELYDSTIKMFDTLVEKGLFDTMRQELNIF